MVNSFSQFHVECIQMNSTKLQIKLHISFQLQNNSEIDEHNRPKFIWMWALRNTHITYFSSLRFIFFSFVQSKIETNCLTVSIQMFFSPIEQRAREKKASARHTTHKFWYKNNFDWAKNDSHSYKIRAHHHHQSRTHTLSPSVCVHVQTSKQNIMQLLHNFHFQSENSIESNSLWHWWQTHTERQTHTRKHQHSHSHFVSGESGKNQFVFGAERKCETIRDIVHDVQVCVCVFEKAYWKLGEKSFFTLNAMCTNYTD